jgi:hypothetical protein
VIKAMNNIEDYIDNEYDDDVYYKLFVQNNEKENADLFFNTDGGEYDHDDVTAASDQNLNTAVKLDEKKTSEQRAINMSFGALIKIQNKNHKRIFIKTVQKMVIKNTEIAIWCGMMMHHIVMNCTSNGIAVPTFTDPKFVAEVVNHNEPPSNHLVIQAKNAFNLFFTPVYEDLDGRPWLLGYLVKFYCGNIISSTKAKWKAFIKDSIDAFRRICPHHYDKQQCSQIKKEIHHLIFTPGSDPPNNVLNMTCHPLADEFSLSRILTTRQSSIGSEKYQWKPRKFQQVHPAFWSLSQVEGGTRE